MVAFRLTSHRGLLIKVLIAVIMMGMLFPAGPARAAGVPLAIVNTYYLNVRSGPSVAFPIIAVISRGQAFVMIGRNADATWVQLRVSGNLTGWVRSAYIRSSVVLARLPITDGSRLVRRYYVVQPGDNLFRIALRFRVNLRALVIINGMTGYNQVFVGQVLIIP